MHFHYLWAIVSLRQRAILQYEISATIVWLFKLHDVILPIISQPHFSTKLIEIHHGRIFWYRISG